MSSGKGTYWANKLLDAVLAAVTFSSPANTYMALYSVAPTAGGGGTEATGTGYARKQITANQTNWPASSGGVISNGVAITMATAGGDWSSGSNQVAAALWDAVSSGNLLYFGSLTTAKPILSGDTASFAIATVSITET